MTATENLTDVRNVTELKCFFPYNYHIVKRSQNVNCLLNQKTSASNFVTKSICIKHNEAINKIHSVVRITFKECE